MQRLDSGLHILPSRRTSAQQVVVVEGAEFMYVLRQSQGRAYAQASGVSWTYVVLACPTEVRRPVPAKKLVVIEHA